MVKSPSTIVKFRHINTVPRLVTALFACVIILGCTDKNASHRVTLTWESPKNSTGHPAAGYNVYRSTTSGQRFAKIASSVAYPWYEDSRVSSGQTYFYAVTALDPMGGESKFSIEVEAKIP